MLISDMKESFEILNKYYDPSLGAYIESGGHEMIYVPPTEIPISEKDISRLKELSWFQEDAEDGDVYEPDLGWSHFI